MCNPLGKSGGSLIQQIMIVSFGSLAASTPYLGVILMGIVIIWILAANSLSKQVPLPPPFLSRVAYSVGLLRRRDLKMHELVQEVMVGLAKSPADCEIGERSTRQTFPRGRLGFRVCRG